MGKSFLAIRSCQFLPTHLKKLGQGCCTNVQNKLKACTVYVVSSLIHSELKFMTSSQFTVALGTYNVRVDVCSISSRL